MCTVIDPFPEEDIETQVGGHHLAWTGLDSAGDTFLSLGAW